jgi:hypothetical protein
MIGSIRKHSAWLWWVIAGLTIISFVVFMGSGPARNGGSSRAVGDYGTIYGHAVTATEFARAQREFYLYYWMRNGQWPNKGAGVSADEMERETYIRLLLSQKAAKLGIVISEDSLVTAASEFLRSLGRNGQSVPMDKFAEQVLTPEGLTVTDLQNFLRDELVVQQMIQSLGLAGALVTPQDAGLIYDRENQEVSAQAVFFSASNYLAQVAVTPTAVAQFYTNYMAAYREPDRVQVNYVVFELSNQLAAAELKIGKTNLDAQVESLFAQHGMDTVPGAKTPAEEKGKIRDALIKQEAATAVRKQANDFANALYAIEPAKPQNLATLAQQKGLTLRTTAPFAANGGPEEFTASAAFVKAAFELTPDEPLAGPLAGADGYYLIALANRLPSAIPSLAEIHDRVVQDYKNRTAVELAQNAGTAFYSMVTKGLAAGQSFAKTAITAGQSPLVLPAFSLSTTELPEIEGRASIGQIKQAAFTAAVGHTSNFVPTADGGFVLFVQELLPINQQLKNQSLPQFIGQVRRARQNEAFNLWLQGEANRELRNTPFFQKQTAGAAKQP